jgi:Na+/H+ antiporter NhaD/arsenite permease-like protein
MTPMAAALTVFFVTYAVVVSERLDRTVAAMAGAVAVVALGLVPYEYALERVDLNVVFLLVGMMMVVSVLADTGLFEWVAVSIAQKARGNGVVILAGLLTATAVLSAFLDNVTTVVLVAPITILIAQILEVRPLPFLILEALFSNIGGTATLVGDPPNILIGLRNGLSFNQFLVNLGPPVLLAGLVVLVLVLIFFRRDVMPRREARLRIMQARPERAITDPVRLRRGLAVFALILAGFVLGHWLHVEPGLVGFAGGFAMAAVCRVEVHRILERVEWDTILFLVALFMLVSSLEYTGLF